MSEEDEYTTDFFLKRRTRCIKFSKKNIDRMEDFLSIQNDYDYYSIDYNLKEDYSKDHKVKLFSTEEKEK